MAGSRKLDLIYGIIFMVHLYYPWQFTKAQGLFPEMRVSSNNISLRGSVELRCGKCPSVSQCHFSLLGIEAHTMAASSCQLALTGRELLTWSRLSVPALVTVKCVCDGHDSNPVSVTVREISLKVSSDITTEMDSVDLSCELPQSPPVSQCIFSLVGKEASKYTTSSCQLSLTGEELMKWSGLVSLPAVVRVRCSFADDPSQHSNPVSVSVKDTPATLPQSLLKISPAVTREDGTVQMTCEVPQSESASLCSFYLSGIEAASYSHSSCQISLTGVQILQWTRQSSPLDADVGCYYRTGTSPGQQTESVRSDLVSVTVLDSLQKPNLKVLDDGSISIVCDIPKHFAVATKCHLYTGDEPQSYLQSKTSKRAAGDLSCQFIVNMDDLIRRLQAARSRGVSCDYTVNTEPPSVSPRSDSYTFTGEQRRRKINPEILKGGDSHSDNEVTDMQSHETVITGAFCLAHHEGSMSGLFQERDSSAPNSRGSLLSGSVVVSGVGLFLVVLTASCLCLN